MSVILSSKSDVLCGITNQEPISHILNAKKYNVLLQPRIPQTIFLKHN